MNKKILAVLTVFLLAGVLPLAAPAASPADRFPDAVVIHPTDFDHLKLYSEPDGAVLDIRLDEANEYYADVKPIVDKKKYDTRWYRIVYCWPYGGSMLQQADKLPEFGGQFAYIRADDVNTEPPLDYVKEQIDWLRAGRPPRFEVGEVLEFGESYGPDVRVVIELQAPATLLAEPREGARKIEVPKGLRYLGPIYETEDNFPVCHADMEEESWALVVDAVTCQVLGWMKPGPLSEISEWIVPE